MSARLKEVISIALNDWFNDHEAGEDGQGEVDHITAAVVAHLASPEVVERAAQALWDEFCPGIRQMPEDALYYRSAIRAALAAAVGGDGTEGR